MFILIKNICLFPMCAEWIKTKTKRILEQHINNNAVNGRVLELGQLWAGAGSTGHAVTGRLQFITISHIS